MIRKKIKSGNLVLLNFCQPALRQSQHGKPNNKCKLFASPKHLQLIRPSAACLFGVLQKMLMLVQLIMLTYGKVNLAKKESFQNSWLYYTGYGVVDPDLDQVTGSESRKQGENKQESSCFDCFFSLKGWRLLLKIEPPSCRSKKYPVQSIAILKISCPQVCRQS